MKEKGGGVVYIVMNFLQVDFYDPEVLQKPHKEAKRKKFYCQESNEMKNARVIIGL